MEILCCQFFVFCWFFFLVFVTVSLECAGVVDCLVVLGFIFWFLFGDGVALWCCCVVLGGVCLVCFVCGCVVGLLCGLLLCVFVFGFFYSCVVCCWGLWFFFVWVLFLGGLLYLFLGCGCVVCVFLIVLYFLLVGLVSCVLFAVGLCVIWVVLVGFGWFFCFYFCVVLYVFCWGIGVCVVGVSLIIWVFVWVWVFGILVCAWPRLLKSVYVGDTFFVCGVDFRLLCNRCNGFGQCGGNFAFLSLECSDCRF